MIQVSAQPQFRIIASGHEAEPHTGLRRRRNQTALKSLCPAFLRYEQTEHENQRYDKFLQQESDVFQLHVCRADLLAEHTADETDEISFVYFSFQSKHSHGFRREFLLILHHIEG